MGDPFDFDEPVDRAQTNSLKWGVAAGELPMWVADMDFRTAPAVRDAIMRRIGHGVFGYSDVPDDYRRAVSSWWGTRHGLEVPEGDIVFSTGVVATISSAVRALTNVHENVLVQPPVYNIFYNSVVNNGRHVLESRLVYDGAAYRIDFGDLEAKLADPQTSLMIVCNPHNPTGNVWSRDDLARIGELCERYGVAVVSDEMHCELTRPGVSHVPFASASDACARVSVTCTSPSKAFNLAGLQSSYFFASSTRLRHRVERQLNTDECAEPNSLAVESTIAAYCEGREWLDALRSYIHGNKVAAARFLASSGTGLRMVESEATYLAWIDCSAVAPDADVLVEHLRAKTGLVVSSGSIYGESGRPFLRMNLGTRRALVEEGLSRLQRGCETF